MRVGTFLLFVLSWLWLTPLAAAEYRDLDWLEMLPDKDRDALLNQSPISHSGGAEGGPRPILGGDSGGYDQSTYAWYSSDFVAELDQQRVRIPGFVVPLTYDEDQRVLEFFLVPYFGACIHMPPPPPNQIIHVKAAKPFKLRTLYDPYVVDGQMFTRVTSNSVGISAYAIEAEDVRPFEE